MLCELQKHIVRSFSHHQGEAIKPMAIIQKLKCKFIILLFLLFWLGHCLHGCVFIYNHVAFKAVTPFVNTAPIKTTTETWSFWKGCQKWSIFKTMRFRWLCKRSKMAKPHRFENGYVFRHEIDSAAKSKRGEPRTECSACLYHHNGKHLGNG